MLPKTEVEEVYVLILSQIGIDLKETSADTRNKDDRALDVTSQYRLLQTSEGII